MGFWILAAILSMGTVALVLPPLLRARQGLPERSAYDLEVYRDQLEEIERDLATGVIGPQEAAAARTEVQRRIIAAGRASSANAHASDASTEGGRGAKIAGIAIMAIVPLAALFVYSDLGSPGTDDLPLAARQLGPVSPTTTAGASPALSDAQMADMGTLVARLAERLEEDPSDPRGWLLLARSYASLGQVEKSVETLRTARQRFPETHEAQQRLSVALAEALVRLYNGEVVPEARLIFQERADAVPDDPRPAYYLGLSAAQRGELQEAYDRWVALARGAPADADWLPGLRQQIIRIAADLGIEPELPPQAYSEAPAAPGPTNEQVAAAAQMSADDRQAMIQGMVEGLAARLESQPDDIEGWLRLVRAFTVLNQRDRAAAAVQSARDTFAEAPEELTRINDIAQELGL